VHHPRAAAIIKDIWSLALRSCGARSCGIKLGRQNKRALCAYLWVLRGRRVTPQRVTTPSVPRPLVMAMVSIISLAWNTLSTVTACGGEQGRRRTCAAQNTVSTWRSGCQSSRWPGTHCPQSQPDNMEKGRGITQEVTSGVILACLWLPLCLLAVLRGYYRGGWLLQYCNQDNLPVP
jgi:hypothetical protein